MLSDCWQRVCRDSGSLWTVWTKSCCQLSSMLRVTVEQTHTESDAPTLPPAPLSCSCPLAAGMKHLLGSILLLCSVMLHEGSGLRCYKCSDYTGRCENVQECTFEDSCISLSESGGKTIRQCIRYTDCDISRLKQMFPAISSFSYRCCNSNLCNSGGAVTMATPALALMGSLLSVCWCWL
uniref:MAC-inhibitory protein n=1 Tax=Oryzias sinensis TaxID=183150 RepID=A0A8C7Z3Q0_9TELE